MSIEDVFYTLLMIAAACVVVEAIFEGFLGVCWLIISSLFMYPLVKLAIVRDNMRRARAASRN